MNFILSGSLFYSLYKINNFRNLQKKIQFIQEKIENAKFTQILLLYLGIPGYFIHRNIFQNSKRG